MNGTSPIDEIRSQARREQSTDGVDADGDPPVQVVEGSRGSRELVDAIE